ncbi:MAG: PEP-CTERM sorting domain-containing protein [Acetobacteraceae bacterium]|nr:PEP-CTERM sorting domain-containing protein [Acetobacteraceae bacterium]
MTLVRSIVCGLIISAAVVPLPATASPFTGLYVLGDSLSDQGNLYAATSALGPSYGQPALPAADHYYSGRFSNGPVYTEELAKDLGVTIAPSLFGGTNFAFGGARTDYNTVEAPPYGTQVYPHAAYPWSLNGQVAAFQSYVAAHGADPNALYVVFSGSNDISDIVQRHMNPATTIANTITGVINAVNAFKAAGAHTVLVPNLPDLGQVPLVTELEPTVPGISALATQLVTEYNRALSAALDQETGIDIVRFDTFDFLDSVIGDPTAYGFTNASAPCYSGFVAPNPAGTVCADPNGYVFWDIEHPTTHAHQVLGDAMFAAVIATPEPASLAVLGFGLATFIACGRRRRAG